MTTIKFPGNDGLRAADEFAVADLSSELQSINQMATSLMNGATNWPMEQYAAVIASHDSAVKAVRRAELACQQAHNFLDMAKDTI